MADVDDATRALFGYLQGRSMAEVAASLSVSEGEARELIRRGLLDRSPNPEDTAEPFRAEAAGLDVLLRPLMARVAQGDLAAMDRYMAVLRRKTELSQSLIALGHVMDTGTPEKEATPLDHIRSAAAGRGAGGASSGGPKVAVKRRG